MNDSQTNLIINYLPQTLSDDEFRSLFSQCGEIKKSRIIRDKYTGYSHGFGFVDYSKPEEAANAISKLNGYRLQHKSIKVAYSRTEKGVNLYVKGLPKHTDQESLREIFKEHGDIVQCRVLTDPYGQCKGVGFVLFSSQDQADNAMAALTGTVLPGSSEQLHIKVAESKKTAQPSRNPFTGGGYGTVDMNYYGSGDPSYSPAAGYNMYGVGPGPRSGGPMRTSANRFRYNPMNGCAYGMQPDVNPVMGHTLFVYNIGSNASDQMLYELFSQFGHVSKASAVYDHQKNQCKGFGFVTMTNYSEALYAIGNLNGYNFYGKQLQVSLKKDKSPYE